jgi:hypothetical protein
MAWRAVTDEQWELIVVTDAYGLPIGLHVTGARPHKSHLADATLEELAKAPA